LKPNPARTLRVTAIWPALAEKVTPSMARSSPHQIDVAQCR
jgi:hypothetical protein